MDNNKVYWVYGNTESVLIPLEEEVMTEQQQIEAVPFYPDANAQVTVNFVGRFKKYSFTPVVNGNLLTVTDTGSLPCGCYGIEVIVVNDDTTQYRSMWENQVVVTISNDPVLREWDEFKEQDVTARAALFFFAKGDKGDPFTYEDFTPEQIEGLQKPATDAAAEIQGDYASNVKGDYAGVKQDAQTATGAANDAAQLANAKAGLANDAATLANQKAGLANDAATLANTKAGLANDAAALANSKAGYAKDQGDYAKAQGDTALADHQRAESDHGIAAADHTASSAATAKASNVNATISGTVVTITDKNGVSTSIDIGFDIYKTYASVSAMNADAENVAEGKFVMIATTDTTSTENARLYVRNSNAPSSSEPFSFLCDLDQAATSAWADWFNNYKPTIESDHTRAENDHTQASTDHSTATSDHTTAGNDHTQAGNDHTQAGNDHTTASGDHTQAGNDHTRAESDHTRAESDHDAVEVYVDSLGVFDLSKHNAVGGVLATYADLNAALTALNALDAKYKYGGMSVKFVQSSDNKYVQARCMAQSFTTNVTQWQGVDASIVQGSKNLVEGGAVYESLMIGDETIIDLSQYTPVQSFIQYYSQGGYWFWNSSLYSYTGIFIPIQPCKKYKILANNSHQALIGVLTTDAHVYGTRVSFATGFSERMSVTEGTSTVITASGDAHYLWVSINNNGADMTPSQVLLYNKQLMSELIFSDYLDEAHSTFLTSGGITSASMLKSFMSSFKMLIEQDASYQYGILKVNNGLPSDTNYAYGLWLYKWPTGSAPSAYNVITIGKYQTSSNPTSGKITLKNDNNDSIAEVVVDWSVLTAAFGDGSAFAGLGNGIIYNQYAIFGKAIESRVDKNEKDISQLNSEVQSLSGSIDSLSDSIEEIYDGPETAYQLPNDLDFFTGSYGTKSITQYTKVAQTDIRFTSIRINKIIDGYGTEYSTTVTYKAYIIKGLADSTKRDAPVLLNGKIGNAAVHTLISEGTFALGGDGYIDYLIKLDKLYTCKQGAQVVVYMTCSRHNIFMRGVTNGSGNPQKTSNVSVISSADNPLDSNSMWTAATFASSTNTGYFNVALTLLRSIPYVSDDELETQVQKIVLPKLSIQIPSTVYAVVDTELNIYNDTVTLSADKGLSSPINYRTVWACSKGTVTERGFRFTPVTGDIGDVSCTCRIYTLYGEQIAYKTFTIKVLAKNALSSPKRIVHFGDSIGAGTAVAMYNDFNNNTRYTGTIPTMLGTKGDSIKYEATGGYRWADYATKGRRAFRCQVNEGESVALNSQYTNNGFTWTVVEVNIGGGNHNILITKNDVIGSDAPQTNGTLVPVGSGNSIPYTDATLQAANPLWNDNTNSLDVALYRQRLGLGEDEKLDAVSFLLGGNNSGDSEENIRTHITNLYNAFIADNPNCLFILCLLTSPANTMDGHGDDYGATGNPITTLANFYRERTIYLSFFGASGFSKLRIAAPNLFLDRYYGYPFSLRRISNRFNGASVTDGTTTIELPAKEVYHDNWLHPTDGGYAQIGDGLFAAFVGVLTD